MSWSSCPGGGATKLGFALLLRFYAVHGRFPAGRGEIPDQAVAHVARLVDVPAAELPSYPVVTFGGPTKDPGLDTKTDLYLLDRSASLGFTGKHVLNITN